MFGTTDLQQVLRYQASLRHDAAQEHRVARPSAKKEQTAGRPRRVLGLRLSLA